MKTIVRIAFQTAGLALIAALAGCQTASTVGDSLDEYQASVKHISSEYGQAIKDFNKKVASLPSTKEADKLRKEAVESLKADLAKISTEVKKLEPPVQAALNHPQVKAAVEESERAVQQGAKGAAGLSAGALKGLGKQLESLGSKLDKAADKPSE